MAELRFVFFFYVNFSVYCLIVKFTCIQVDFILIVGFVIKLNVLGLNVLKLLELLEMCARAPSLDCVNRFDDLTVFVT